MNNLLDQLEEMFKAFPPDLRLIQKATLSSLHKIRVDFEENWVPRERSITWGVDDFVSRAELQEELGETDGLPWKEYYDEELFEQACIEMINSHDANYGITWDRVDCFLEDCKR